MKYEEYVQRYKGIAVRIIEEGKGKYTITRTDRTPPYTDEILEVHEDFIIFRQYQYGGAPGEPIVNKEIAAPLKMVVFEL